MERMISAERAEELVLGAAPRFGVETVPFREADGRILREPIRADRPIPPYDRVMMDGIALNRELSIRHGLPMLRIVGAQRAGMEPLTLAEEGTCIEIATGAVLPRGCDTIIPVERYEKHGELVRLEAGLNPVPGEYIHRTGSDAGTGKVVLEAGCALASSGITIAVSAGMTDIPVARRPKVTVISTGDELRGPGDAVAPHEVRLSNPFAIRSALIRSGLGEPVLKHVADDQRQLHGVFANALASSEALICSGGVSKGFTDFVPAILENCGVRLLFHGVRQRPGKPFLFGVSDAGCLVFAAPGNPVSCLTCVTRYIIPCLRQAMGESSPIIRWGTLGDAFQFSPALTRFLPVRREWRNDGIMAAFPAPSQNSGDYAGLAGTDGFVQLPGEGMSEFSQGFTARFFPWP